MPLLLNIWEKNGLDRHFDIFLAAAEPRCLSAAQSAALKASDVCIFSFMTPHLTLFAAEIKSLRAAGKSAPRLAAGGPHISGEREIFKTLKKNGLASDWWQGGERSARAYLSWLEGDFPGFFAQFT